MKTAISLFVILLISTSAMAYDFNQEVRRKQYERQQQQIQQEQQIQELNRKVEQPQQGNLDEQRKINGESEPLQKQQNKLDSSPQFNDVNQIKLENSRMK